MLKIEPSDPQGREEPEEERSEKLFANKTKNIQKKRRGRADKKSEGKKNRDGEDSLEANEESVDHIFVKEEAGLSQEKYLDNLLLEAPPSHEEPIKKSRGSRSRSLKM